MALTSKKAGLLSLLVLALAAIRASFAAGQEDTLRLTNGDILHGQLVSIDPDQGASWRHEHVKEPLVFSMASLKRITLRPASRPPAQGATDVIRITNGDVLHGTLVSLAEDKLRIDTSCAQQISIHRSMVSSIALLAGSDVVFEGPSGTDQWQISPTSSWQYRNAVRIRLADTGSITLNLKRLLERRITGSSENYGDATVSLDSVVSLDFNIYNEDATKGSRKNNLTELGVEAPGRQGAKTKEYP